MTPAVDLPNAIPAATSTRCLAAISRRPFWRVRSSLGAKCLLLFDPTRGVDVGAKQSIYAMMADFVHGGGAILFYSTELDELVHLCDRCLVLYRNHIAGEVSGAELTQEPSCRSPPARLAQAQPIGGRRTDVARHTTGPARGAAIAVLIYLVMYLVYAISEASATSVFAITNLLNNAIVLAIAAAGPDAGGAHRGARSLRLGVIAIANVVVATTSTGILGCFGSLVAVMLIGAAVGLLNGWLVIGLGLQSLAVTIGTMIACQGMALMILAAPGGEVADTIANGLTGDIADVVPVAAMIISAFCCYGLSSLALASVSLSMR